MALRRERSGDYATRGLLRFPPFRAVAGLLDAVTLGVLDFQGKNTGLQSAVGFKQNKRGFFGSTIGNFMRAAVVGALVVGALALTGGLAAVPLLGGMGALGAMAVGGAALGAANATFGMARHAAVTAVNVVSAPFVLTAKLFRGVKNMFGGGEKLANGVGRSAMAGPEAGVESGVMGKLIGAAAATIAAKMGVDTFMGALADKVSGIFGGREAGSSSRSSGERSERSGSRQGSEATASQSAGEHGKPQVPGVLADKMVTNDKGEEVLRLSREDLANPEIRDAVKNYGSAMKNYCDQLGKGSADDKREAASMLRTAAGQEGTRPKKDPNTGMYEVSAEHLMNGDVVQAMTHDGRKVEKEQTRAARAEERAADKELKAAQDANRGNGAMFRRVDSVFDKPQESPQQPQAAPEAAQASENDKSTFDGIADNLKNGPEAKDPVIRDNQDGHMPQQNGAQPEKPQPQAAAPSGEDFANMSPEQRRAHHLQSLVTQAHQSGGPSQSAPQIDERTAQAAAATAEKTHGAPTRSNGTPPSGASVAPSAEHVARERAAAAQRN